MIPMLPDQTFELATEQAEAMPEQSRPALVCRFRSYATSLEFERLIEQAESLMRSESDESPEVRRQRRTDGTDCILNALKLYVVGWRNVVDDQGQPIPFSHDRLAGVGSLSDLWELAYRLPGVSRLSESDKKKSVSSSQGATGESAPAAGAENATMSPAN